MSGTIETIKNPQLLNLMLSRSGGDMGSKTILYNCNCHTFDAVIQQIMRAIGCPRVKAEDLAVMADKTGTVIVYEGTLKECEKVAEILGSIGLRVEVG